MGTRRDTAPAGPALPDPSAVDDTAVRMLTDLEAQGPQMLDLLEVLVSSESFSSDAQLLAASVDLVADHGTRLLGAAPDRLDVPGAPVLRWTLPPDRSTSAPVVLLAHIDTVWPTGTLARWPFTVEDGRATGPGVFDMKAGLVQALFGVRQLLSSGLPRPPVVLLVTADEEIGSPAGREVIEHTARGAAAVLVLEASAGGRLKIARKGVSNYDLHLTGRAAHAGLEPERGVNALTDAAHLVLALAALADPAAGTTVTPTTATAGTSRNTVPASATVTVDVRAATVAEQTRVDTVLRALIPPGGSALTVGGGTNRPPMQEDMTVALAALADRAAARCGLPSPGTARVGGGSDGNFTAALGVPTLDGLGAVGAGAHAEGEWIAVSALPERAALLAALIGELA